MSQSAHQQNTAAVEQMPLSEIIISAELAARPLRQANTTAETAALRSLAAALPEGRDRMLKRLAKLGIELCDAGSAGVSVIEECAGTDQVFRWRALAGMFEPYEGGETPRHWSPCGTCLDTGKAMLYSYPARHFTYFQAVDIPIVEGLVIPMYSEGSNGATIWIVSHTEDRRFDAEDVRVMTALASFATQALRHPPTDEVFRVGDGQNVMADGTLGSLRTAPFSGEALWQDYMQGVAHGDSSALTALFNATSPLVFSAALRVLGFRSEAEEIMCDVYATVWKKARSYDRTRGSVAGWLSTIARNQSFDHLRSHLARSRTEIPLPLDLDCCGTIDLERELMAGQAKNQVLAAVQALPRTQRTAIELRYFSGLTCPEIAQKMGQPLGTIKTRIRLGLQKLRRLLAAVA